MVAASLAVRRPEEVVAGDDREARLRNGLACCNQARDHLVPASICSSCREFKDDIEKVPFLSHLSPQCHT